MTTSTTANSRPKAAAPKRRALPGSTSSAFPFWVGLAALLAVALVAAATLGRAGLGAELPDAVVRYQEGLTVEAAQNVRRGLNEGVADLAQAAATTDPGASPEVIGDVPAIVFDTHDRYRAVFVQRLDGTVLADAGPDDPRPVPARVVGGEAVILPVGRDASGRVPLIQQVAPVPAGGAAVVGHYDPAFLAFALSTTLGESWVVDDAGRVLSATSGHIPFSDLPSTTLRRAAQRASGGAPGSLSPRRGGRGDLVSWAPVSGEGPGGQLGWSVVTRRSAGTLSLPATDARREGLVVSVVTAAMTVAVFAWLWLVVLAPIRRLRAESERVALGELGSPVAIVRYDEIGLTSRALDRLRVLLVAAGHASAPRAGTAPAIGRTPSRLRQAVVGLAVVAGFAAFVAALVVITEYGTSDQRDTAPAPVTTEAATTTTAATSTSAAPAPPPPDTPAVRVNPLTCELSSSSVTYRAEIEHGEQRPVRIRIEVAVRSGADGTVLGIGGGESTANPQATTPLAVAIPVRSGALPADAMCVVTRLETSRT